MQKIDYSFPDEPVDPDLKDLFKNVFTSKANRLSASQLKQHPWIVSISHYMQSIAVIRCR